MAALDWIFLAVLAASLLLGAWRGLVFELLSLAGWVVAFFAAQWFVGAVFACGLVAWLLKKLVEAVGLRPADRALGALFGVLRGLVLLLAVVLVAGWLQVQEAPWWKESQAAPMLQGALKGLRPVLPEELGRHLPS